MYLIAGLGNPGKQYENTRHNIGFDMLDLIGKRYDIKVETVHRKHQVVTGKGMVAGESVLLVKPQTYMNASGESIGSLLSYYDIDPVHQFLVLYDDISLPVGQLRIRQKGSAGGHNGIKSIISHVGSQEFLRLKVGAGRKPKDFDQVAYVLGKFSKEEREQLDTVQERLLQGVELLLQGKLEEAMNLCNVKSKERQRV